MAAKQTLHLGPHAARVSAGFKRLADDHVLQRLWARDTALWSSEAAVQAAIRNRLGWLRMPQVMTVQADSLAKFAREVREAGYTHALLLGMGGSGLYPEVCRRTFGVLANGLDLALLDSTDPTAIRLAQSRCPLSRLLVIVSSKSGATSETAALIRYFYETLSAAGLDAGAQCVAITDTDTPLELQAKRLKFRRVFTHGMANGADVGGRFSAVVGFGLLPAALLGVDLGRLLASEQGMAAACGPQVPVEENPAAQLGATLGTLAQAGYDKLTLLASPALASFGSWVEQLVAESIGKLGKGIAPIFGEPLRAPEAYGTDRVFVELQLATQPDVLLQPHVQALIDAGHPVIRVLWDDPYDLGGDVIKWSVATALLGYLLELNPFDEPNVKESKDTTQALLQHYAQHGRLPEDEPAAFSDEQLAVFGEVAGQPASLEQCLRDVLQRLRSADYITLLSFLPRTPQLDDALVALRRRLAEQTRHATMLGFGPRYLHSTGQLYKGGPDAGVFFLLTAESTEDLSIPGEPFTFSVLKHAQALGDYQAMRQHGRRILRIHLKGKVDAGFASVARALEAALAAAAPR